MRDRQREETRQKLYHAALEVFCRDGVYECRIEDIAQRAEVSRAAFYFHFPSKDDVLLELLRETEHPVAEALVALPAEAALEAVFATVVEQLAAVWGAGERSRLLVDVFAVSLRRTRVVGEPEVDPVRTEVGRRFKLAAERGELSGLVPAEVLADFFLLNCLSAMASWSVAPTLPLAAMLHGVVHLFLSGARAPASAPPSAPRARKG